MKKLVLVLMVMCGLIVGLTACGGSSDPVWDEIEKQAEEKQAAERVNHWDYPVVEGYELDLENEEEDVYYSYIDEKGKPDENGNICRTYIIKERTKEKYDQLLEKAKKPDQTNTEAKAVDITLKDSKSPIKIDYAAITYYPDGGYMTLDVFYNAEGLYGTMQAEVNDLDIEEREEQSEKILKEMVQQVLGNTGIIKD